MRIGLGSDQVENLPMPFEANPKALVVSLSEVAHLLHRDDELVRVWYLAPGSARHQVELDQEMQDTLRALGYIQ